jgi:uncharacterized membrane protein YeiH
MGVVNQAVENAAGGGGIADLFVTPVPIKTLQVKVIPFEKLP